MARGRTGGHRRPAGRFREAPARPLRTDRAPTRVAANQPCRPTESGYRRPMPDTEPMGVEAALAGCNRALTLQYRSALELTLLAGSLTGPTWHPIGTLLWTF